MCRTVDALIKGKIDRLLVTVPPGYNKTSLFVVMLIARGLAINPASRFIYVTYSDKLVLEKSSQIRDIVRSPEYRNHWDVELKEDTDAKGLWRTKEGGGVLASPSGGAITGFRAGLMRSGFGGAFIIDDPLKPDDALSEVTRTHINERWHTTFKSRLAHVKVPVVVIMQRLHIDDFAGFLLRGDAGCEWHHLFLPVEIDNSLDYPIAFTHGIEIEHGLPDGPLWERRFDKEKQTWIGNHNADDIEELKKAAYTYAAQYAQNPLSAGGAVFREDHLLTYRRENLPQFQYRQIFADTAQKTEERSDYTVFQCWAKGIDGKAYMIDQVREKLEAPDLLRTAKIFWERHKGEKHASKGHLREFCIEDKSSGTGLIQQLRRLNVPVRAIERTKDKFTRAQDVLPYFANRMVLVPEDAPWTSIWKLEMLNFDGVDNRASANRQRVRRQHDDQVDVTIDAVHSLLTVSRRGMEDVL